MAKHTPGPWQQDKWGDIYPVGGREKIQVVGVSLSCGSGGDQHNEAEANARLIAAAPELLAACEDLAEQLEFAMSRLGACGHGDRDRLADDVPVPGGQSTLDSARAVITKAKGEPTQ